MSGGSEPIEIVTDVLRLAEHTMPARWSEDTVEELLRLVHLTFGEYLVAVLAEPLPRGVPTDDSAPLAVKAALHGQSVAALLTALTLRHTRELSTEDAPPDPDAQRALRGYWCNAICAAATDQNAPEHESAVDYVRGAATGLNFVTRALGTQQGLSLEPDDPRGIIEPADQSFTSEDAGGILVWCAAAALTTAARLQPDFKLQTRSS
jgi:hypothetical protein